MDGSPQVARFDATTLWHLDAAEWAPSTASFASDRGAAALHGMSAMLPSVTDSVRRNETSRSADGDSRRSARVANVNRSPYEARSQIPAATP